MNQAKYCNIELEGFISFYFNQGIYVANLSHHRVDGVATALELLNKGRKELVIAETKMVRHSSR